MYKVYTDLSKFPKEITLKKGSDKNRIWYEFWNNKKSKKKRRGIVIQAYLNKDFFIFIIKGEEIYTVHKEIFGIPELDMLNIAAFKNVQEAIECLKSLGFSVSINE